MHYKNNSEQRLALALPGLVAFAILAPAAVQTAHANSPEGPTLETVEVHGQRLRLDLLREQALTPGGVTVIDSDTLFQRTMPNLADMLRYAPGVWANSTSGGDGVFLSIRGSNLDATNFDRNGVKLLQDGLPITTADGNNHNRLIDPLSTRFATIARGANAMTYGASTLGGAINFNSPTALNSSPLQLFANAGSHGRMDARAMASGVLDNGLDGLVSVKSNNWDGYREHSREEHDGIFGNTGWNFSNGGDTRFYGTYLSSKQDLPGALTEEQFKDNPGQAAPEAELGNYQLNVDTWRVANKTRWALTDNSSLELGVSWEEQTLHHPIVYREVDFDGPGPLPPQEVFSLLIDTDHRDAGVMGRYELQLDSHDLLFGFNYGDGEVSGGNYRNNNGKKNGETTAVDRTAQNLEAFALDRWRLAPQWTLVYGAQVVWAERDVKNTDVATAVVRNPSADYDSINPRLGVLYDINDSITLFANASRVFEAPTNYELEDDVRGDDQTLDPMEGAVLEIGSRGEQAFGEASKWYWDVALYYAQINDEILSVDDPFAPGTSLTANVDKTIHAGIESQLGGTLTLDGAGRHLLEPTLTVTLNEFSFDNDATYGNNDLPAAPDYAVRGELLYRDTSGFYVGPTFDLVGDRYADFNNSYKVDSYTLLGLRGGFISERWEVFVEATNLQDTEYVSTLSVRNIAAPDAPILNSGAPLSLYAGVRFQL